MNAIYKTNIEEKIKRNRNKTEFLSKKKKKENKKKEKKRKQ